MTSSVQDIVYLFLHTYYGRMKSNPTKLSNLYTSTAELTHINYQSITESDYAHRDVLPTVKLAGKENIHKFFNRNESRVSDIKLKIDKCDFQTTGIQHRGILIVVIGELFWPDTPVYKFTQTFVLTPILRNTDIYEISNDIIRFVPDSLKQVRVVKRDVINEQVEKIENKGEAEFELESKPEPELGLGPEKRKKSTAVNDEAKSVKMKEGKPCTESHTHHTSIKSDIQNSAKSIESQEVRSLTKEKQTDVHHREVEKEKHKKHEDSKEPDITTKEAGGSSTTASTTKTEMLPEQKKSKLPGLKESEASKKESPRGDQASGYTNESERVIKESVSKKEKEREIEGETAGTGENLDTVQQHRNYHHHHHHHTTASTPATATATAPATVSKAHEQGSENVTSSQPDSKEVKPSTATSSASTSTSTSTTQPVKLTWASRLSTNTDLQRETKKVIVTRPSVSSSTPTDSGSKKDSDGTSGRSSSLRGSDRKFDMPNRKENTSARGSNKKKGVFSNMNREGYYPIYVAGNANLKDETLKNRLVREFGPVMKMTSGDNFAVVDFQLQSSQIEAIERGRMTIDGVEVSLEHKTVKKSSSNQSNYSNVSRGYRKYNSSRKRDQGNDN